MNRLSITRRQALAVGAGAVAGLSLRPAMAQSDFDLRPRQVADGVWMIEGRRESFARGNGGFICNIALIETGAGAVIIDTGSTMRFGAQLRGFADQRLGGVAAVFNTHQHPDHWFGNQAFADRPILALPETRALSEHNGQGYAEGLYRILGSWMNETNPTPANDIAAPGEAVIGGRRLNLMALAGHTQADLVVLDQTSGTLIAGDMLFLDRAPSFPDADIARWKDGLEQISSLGVSGIIPGHGEFHRSSEAIVQTRAYLDAFDARMRLALDAGLAPSEAIAAGPMPDQAATGANPEEYQRSVVQRWRDYETDALPVIGGA